MRKFALLAALALVAGCAKKEAPPAPEPPPVAPPAPAPIDMSAVAGTWDMKTMATGSDSVLVSYTMTATANTSGWTLNFPKRKPVPLTITVSGDSIMGTSAPYESVLRKGVTVRTTSVYHLVNGQLKGAATAYYSKGPDSVKALRSTGSKHQQ